MNRLLCFKHLSEKLHKANPQHHHSFFIKPFHSLSKAGALFKPTTPHNLIQHSPTTYGFKQFSSIAHFKGPISSFPKDELSFRTIWLLYCQTWRSLPSENIVLGLIVANVAVFVLWPVSDRDFMSKHFMVSMDSVKSGRKHTMITSGFSHIDIKDLVGNMTGLYFFGKALGRHFGGGTVLIAYLAGAYSASDLYVRFQEQQVTLEGRDHSKTPLLVSNGAVNSIMFSCIFLLPKEISTLRSINSFPLALLGVVLIGRDVSKIIAPGGDAQLLDGAVGNVVGALTAAFSLWTCVKLGLF